MSLQKQKTLDLEEEESKGKSATKNGQNDDEEAWAKITSISQSSEPKIYILKENKVSIGRNSSATICIEDKRLSGVHCEIERQDNSITITDLSTNGTFVNNIKIGKTKSQPLQNGDLIHLLHHSKVKESETLAFFFTLCKIENLKRKDNKTEDETIKKDLEKLKKLDDELGEGMKCVICLDYIYQCVTLIDCLHNFCGACFSDWMKKSKECPNCRNQVKAVKKNPIINSIITQYLDAHPDKQRPEEEYKEMDSKNKITCDLLELEKSKNKRGKKAAPVRGRRGLRQRISNDEDSDVSYESDSNDNNRPVPVAHINIMALNHPLIVCTECSIPRSNDGFKCGRNQIHIYCMSCRQAFPDRGGANYKQKCEICNIAYCNLYFNCKSNRNPKLYELKDHKLEPTLKPDIFRANQYEFHAFDDHMKAKNITCKDIFEEINENYIKKDKFKYIVNKHIVSNPIINLEINIHEDSAICTTCFFLVWFQIVYLYRKDHHKDMPDEIKKRGNCWYGINCSTMKHNPDHAKKLNHICDQSKF